MGLTQKQLESRRHYIGASEVPVLFGENRYVTEFDLWAFKTGRVSQYPLENEAAEVGILLEDFVLNYAEQKLGKLRRNQQRVAANGIVRATLDAQLVETREPVEAKTTGIVGNVYGVWGEDGSDEIPNWTLLQVQTQLMCVAKIHEDVEFCWVAALIGQRGRALFKIRKSEKIIDEIKRRTEEFWACVAKDIPPENSAPSFSVATRLISEEGLASEIPSDLVREFYTLHANQKVAKTQLDNVKARVLATLDKAEIGQVDGVTALTAKSQKTPKKTYIGDNFDKDFKVTYTEFRKLIPKKGFDFNG